jgi:hypothetical protein
MTMIRVTVTKRSDIVLSIATSWQQEMISPTAVPRNRMGLTSNIVDPIIVMPVRLYCFRSSDLIKVRCETGIVSTHQTDGRQTIFNPQEIFMGNSPRSLVFVGAATDGHSRLSSEFCRLGCRILRHVTPQTPR